MYSLINVDTGVILYQSDNKDYCIEIGLILKKLNSELNVWVF